MNKTDKMKEAMQNFDNYGTDPDNIMMLTTDEWAKAKGEKVDTYDADEISLSQMVDALEMLDRQIELIKIDIEATEELMQKYQNNYQMKYEYQKELNELNHNLLITQTNRERLFKKYMALKDFYDRNIARS